MRSNPTTNSGLLENSQRAPNLQRRLVSRRTNGGDPRGKRIQMGSVASVTNNTGAGYVPAVDKRVQWQLRVTNYASCVPVI